METLLTRLLGATVLVSLSLFLPAALAQNKPTPQAKTRRTKPDNHPKIREAIVSLEAAKAELEQANGDFGGHKTEAIEAVNNALKRLRLALQFEKY
jgi:outer membrane protein TolC